MTTSDQSITVQQANRYVLCFQYSDASSTDYLDQVNDPQYQQEVQFRCERSYESMSILHVSFFSRGLGRNTLGRKDGCSSMTELFLFRNFCIRQTFLHI